MTSYLNVQQELPESDLTLANIEMPAANGDRQEGAPFGVQYEAIQVVNGKK